MILIVEARFYEDITDTLAEGALAVLEQDGHSADRIEVPGVFEIPAAVNLAWNSGAYAGCVTLGCVIRGETDHYDHICREMSRRLMDMSVDQNMPHGFGVLTVDSIEQAIERSGTKAGNKGEEAAIAAIEMASLYDELKDALK